MIKLTVFICYLLPTMMTPNPICGTLVYNELFNTIDLCEEITLDVASRLRLEAYVDGVTIVGDMIFACTVTDEQMG